MTAYTIGQIGLNFRGEYDSEAHYNALDVVTHRGSSYIAVAASSGEAVTNALFWQRQAQGINSDYYEYEADTDIRWIDGKTIYRYVWVGTVTNDGSQSLIFDLPCNPSTIISVRGMMKAATTNQWWPVPYSYYNNNNWNTGVYTSDNHVYFNAGSGYSGTRTLLLFIEYTKQD